MARRSKDTIERRLASSWNAPTVLPEDVDGTGCGHPRACLATTYTFHAGFFESDLLPRFLGLRFDHTERERAFVIERERALGAVQATVLVDQEHVDGSQSTLRWDQMPVDVPGGVQHAKVSVLMWERCVRLIVASANLTRQGYRRNREIAGVIDFFDSVQSAPRSLGESVLDFFEDLLASGWVRAGNEAQDRLVGAVGEIRRSLRAWRRMPADFTPRELPRVAFIAGLPARPGRGQRSPLGQMITQWGARRANDVTVMTPFVGESAESQRKVIERLKEVTTGGRIYNRLVVP